MMFQFLLLHKKYSSMKQPIDYAQIPWVRNSDRPQWEGFVTTPQYLELSLRRLEGQG